MLDWWKRRQARKAYERDALVALYWLLDGDEASYRTRALLSVYPGALKAIELAHTDARPVRACAAQIASSMITDLVEKHIPAESRRATLDAIANWRQQGHTELDRLAGSDARWLVSVIGRLYDWVELGSLDCDIAAIVVDEIIGALHGESPTERSNRRVLRAVETAWSSSAVRGEGHCAPTPDSPPQGESPAGT